MKGLMRCAGAAGLLALCGCAGSGGVVNRMVLRVSMTGIQEVPGPGDADGNGTAEVRVTVSEGQVCWDVYARDIDAATAAHIHRGAAGIAGPPVVTLATPDAAGRSQGCATVDPMVARDIAMRGHEYYLNVHTGPHPAGAIRGQLRGAMPMRAPRQGTTG
jgi:hypothetical protein